jgi:hypothetical protein
MCKSHPDVIDLKVGSMKAVILAKAGIYFTKHGCPTMNLWNDENCLFSCSFVIQELTRFPQSA